MEGRDHSEPRRARWRLFAAGAVFAVIVAAVFVLRSVLTSNSPRSANTPMSAERSAAIVSELLSGSATGVAEAVALPPGTVLSIHTVNALAQLRKLRLDQESFKEVGRDVAVMKATLGGADGATQTWMMTLSKRTTHGSSPTPFSNSEVT